MHLLVRFEFKVGESVPHVIKLMSRESNPPLALHHIAFRSLYSNAIYGAKCLLTRSIQGNTTILTPKAKTQHETLSNYHAEVTYRRRGGPPFFRTSECPSVTIVLS